MTIIKDYYANCSELSEEDFQKYRQLYPIFDPSLQEIIKDMLYTYTVHRQRSLKQITGIYEELHIEESIQLINILNRCYQAFYEDRFLDCFKDALYLEEQFCHQQNYNRLLDVYDAIVLLYAQLQKGKNNRIYEDKLFALLKEHQEELHPNKYLQAIYQCGMLYLENGAKEEACQCFCELAQKDAYHYLPAALFACMLKDELKQELPAAILRDPQYPQRFPKHVRTFHAYYQLKHSEASLEELEAFLCDKVFPLLSDDDELLKKTAREELHQLVRKSGHYYLKKRI